MYRPVIFTDPPPAPLRGMVVFTLPRCHYGQDGHPLMLWALGEVRRVSAVNTRSFYARDPKARRQERRLLVEWLPWLSQLQAEHWVWILEGEDDPAGWRQLRPMQPGLAELGGGAPRQEGDLDPFEIDQRIQRARAQVLPRYRLSRSDRPEGCVVVCVEGGAEVYEVLVRLDGAEPPRCSCPDAEHRREMHGGFCKHAVAVLLSFPDLRGQLLTALL